MRARSMKDVKAASEAALNQGGRAVGLPFGYAACVT